MSEFKPYNIATATFANGESFKIDRVKASGACRITDTNTGTASYAHSIANAWKSVMFKARVDERTHNTSRWRG
jgi:hypothetical protein